MSNEYSPPTLGVWRAGQQWRPLEPDDLAAMDPQTRQAFDDAEAAAVFGVGFKRDAMGRPVERGIGSAANLTPSARAANTRAGIREDDLKKKAGLE
jgi:hypothetical protein